MHWKMKIANHLWWKKIMHDLRPLVIFFHHMWFAILIFQLVRFQQHYIFYTDNLTCMRCTQVTEGLNNFFEFLPWHLRYIEDVYLLLHFGFWHFKEWHFQKCHFQIFSEMTLGIILQLWEELLIFTLSRMTLSNLTLLKVDE